MAFLSLDLDKSDAARGTTSGRKAVAFPTLDGITPTSVRPSGCAGCAHAAAHDVCEALAFLPPHGEGRYDRVPVDVRPDVQTMHDVQAALFRAAYCFQGYIGNELLYNVGASGDNGSQFVTYEVVSAAGDVLTLKGPNPKRVLIGSLRVNPEWPFPDPATGLTSRLVPEGREYALPAGASVEFSYPSVLERKARPMIVKVNPPATDAATAEFTVIVDQTVENATSPLDLAFPPGDGKYWCRVRWEATSPARWLNLQAPHETQFTRHTAEFTSAAVHELLDTGGNSTRVLWPGMLPGAALVTMHRQGGGTELVGAVASLLETVQTGTGTWETTIDLTGFDFVATYEKAVVVYHPEARAADDYRLPFQSSCSHSQVDFSGSYVHRGGRRCQLVDSSGFEAYEGECWQPGCDGFALGNTVESYGSGEYLPDDMGDAGFWGGLWHRASWIVQQGVPGMSAARNFSLSRPSGGGPSVQSLCGAFVDEVPGGLFASRNEHESPKLGQLLEWTDEDGHERMGLWTGAFYGAGVLFDSDGPDKRWVAGTTPAAGGIAAAVSGWGTKDEADGVAMNTGLARLPWRNVGRTSVYSFAGGGNAMGRTNEVHENSEAFIVAITKGLVFNDVAEQVRGRFA